MMTMMMMVMMAAMTVVTVSYIGEGCCLLYESMHKHC